LTDSLISGVKDLAFNSKYTKAKLIFGIFLIALFLGVVLYKGSMAN